MATDPDQITESEPTTGTATSEPAPAATASEPDAGAVTERRRAIVEEAEALLAAEDVAAADRRLRGLADAFEAAGAGADRDLRRRLTTVQREQRRVMDALRAEAARVKGELASIAEGLAGSTEWGPTAGRLKELQREWKAAGSAGRDEGSLWARFRAAQDAFFAARSAAFAERDAHRAENVAAKAAVVERAERLGKGRDAKAGRGQIAALMEEWKAAGSIPKAEGDRLWARLSAALDAIRAAGAGDRRAKAEQLATRAEADLERHEERLAFLEYRDRDLSERVDAMPTDQDEHSVGTPRADTIADRDEIRAELGGVRAAVAAAERRLASLRAELAPPPAGD